MFFGTCFKEENEKKVTHLLGKVIDRRGGTVKGRSAPAGL